MRRINYRHYICAAIVLGFIALAVFIFPNALGRIIESGRDFGLSAAFYFCEIFNIDHSVIPTVNSPAQIPFFDFFPDSDIVVPPLAETAEEFSNGFIDFCMAWFSNDNFFGYLSFLGNLLLGFAQFLSIAVPIFIGLLVLLRFYFNQTNTNHNRDTVPLRVFKFIARPYKPTKEWLIDFYDFIISHKIYIKIWIFIWLWNFNIVTVALEFVAYWLYFAAAFDFTTLYMQVYKLALDLAVPFTFIPIWLWIFVVIALIVRWRRKIGFYRLNHMEWRNSDFIESTPIIVMLCGAPGTGKTKLITDMALTQVNNFRKEAYRTILECDFKFPKFPWIVFENRIKSRMKNHQIFNLVTCVKFVNELENEFNDYIAGEPDTLLLKNDIRAYQLEASKILCDYNYERYGTKYNDNLKIVSLFDVLRDYAQAYFIFYVPTALSYSNYSIRFDIDQYYVFDESNPDVSNFPMWNFDFFKRDPRLMKAHSKHAHILDFDMLRLGKQLAENNARADAFEFGVISITEVGKERGNMLENQGKKRNDNKANPLNDFMNRALKMIRNPSTVNHFPYVKVFTDEQRPESWGADARDLCEIIDIEGSSDTHLAMPLFSLEELLHSFLMSRFKRFYEKYRFNRGDNTLWMYILKSIVTKFNDFYVRTYNQFSYKKLTLSVKGGSVDDKTMREGVYYEMSKKVKSGRYASDYYKPFYTEKISRAQEGIMEIPEYADIVATRPEMRLQNSYFNEDMESGFYQLPNTEAEIQRAADEYIKALSPAELDKAVKDGEFIRKVDKLRETLIQHPELLPDSPDANDDE